MNLWTRQKKQLISTMALALRERGNKTGPRCGIKKGEVKMYL